MSKNLLIVGGKAWSIINFRGSLIKKLIQKGFKITAVASEATALELEEINKLGVSYVDIKLKSNRISIFSDFIYYLKLKNIISNLDPDIILSYTFKPVVYSGLAIFLKKNINFFPLITGLGNIFNTKRINFYPIKLILILLCKISLRNAKTIIFQNIENLEYFKNLKIAPKVKKIIIEGSGVNIDHFTNVPFTNNKDMTFLLIARLLKDKGIIEYIEAAKQIKLKLKNIKFNLIGPKDNSNNKVNIDYIKNNHKKGVINYLGFQKNVKPFIADSHVYVLPSYHEGLPRSVLEAMAMGRPIITTRVPGCKETIVNNENGFLIPSKNISSLVEKITWFINNKKEIYRMGKNSRTLVIERFSSEKIDKKFIELLSDSY